MSPNFDSSLKIEIKLASNNPELLHGLDIWLRLGLISDTQVKQICREFLVCRVELQPQTLPEPQAETLHATSLLQDDALPTAKKPNVLARMLQSLGEELSVRWLLFLGMFLVVVSSGVLAASQWQRFPPSGQYGVLLAYTLSFWGISFWAGRQSHLSLTTRTLLIVTLLLVPVNFWAMDSFNLWQNPLNWVVIAIASITLSAITFLFCNNRLFSTYQPARKLSLVNILALSYLHWGWQIPGFSLIAVYLATVGTTLATIYHTRHPQRQTIVKVEDQKTELGISLSSLVIVYALFVLLVRAIFVVRVEIQELGLAVGICGWLVTRLAQSDKETRVQGKELSSISLTPSVPHPPPSLPWELLGGILLFLGWLVSVSATFPWQATAVSGLGLWCFSRRLQLGGTRVDVGAIFAIGLETIWLLWLLVPFGLQEWAISTATQLTHSQNTPWALLSVVLFPYLVLMVALTDRLYRAQKVQLADFGEKLTLLFGISLTAVSLVNPTLRSLNLLLSAITLGSVSQRRVPTRISLVYMTQIAEVLTLCSIIDRFFPYLNTQVWASIVLAVAVAEWLFCCLGNGVWHKSAWYMGLGLAALSYTLLWMNAEPVWFGSGNNSESWGLVWLITPMTLTGVAIFGLKSPATAVARPTLNAWLSVAALGLAQLLILPLSGGRLIGLAVASALMFVNTRYLRHKLSALITVGFGLGFIAALLWEGVPGLARLSLQGWFVVGGVCTVGLWLVRKLLSTRENELVAIYAEASDKWAIALCTVELLLLSIHSTLVYQGLTKSDFLYLTSSAIILGAIVYRSWQQPSNWSFYGIGWCLELLIAEVLGFGERSIIKIAIANIALGLVTQVLGEWWRSKHRLEKLPNRWHILPLLYGVFGVALRSSTFANWTGLSSVAVAFIVIGVGRRRRELKPLLYLGLIGISISAYELLFYQLLQAPPGGAYGDGLIAMSVLGTGIMYAYRLLSAWLVDYLRLTSKELKVVAHIHWVLSSCLLFSATFTPIAINYLVGLGTGVFLIRYAIFQGRYHPQSTMAQMWVYLGLLEIAGFRTFWIYTAVGRLFAESLLPWRAPIASVVAYFLYILPWERWGWSKRPWQNAAYILPLIYLWESRGEIYPVGLLITAGFYAFIAKVSKQFRFTYVSVVLIDWALFRWFLDLHLSDALWYVIPIGLSLLYVAQFDPSLREFPMKASRHSVRLLGCGLICGWAIIFHQDTAFIPGFLSLIAIFAGLALRVRAFLYVGTSSFFITSFYQLVIFSLHYPFLKWVVGLLVGIILISIAANFETRREQINSLLRNSSQQLQEWE
ncbi:DUF2157 domain-containing protein [Brasilonema octagenarum]|uniref:DUF2157 domain-containing protein n=1 Tax=Brasilonema octagenarum UFV-OR1 TaxID=417115 RepID=A0ABX1MIT6_9CYAN|nr:DUF2157 domain-containing protein [Brasilonema octagenarum]NMF66971.1 DUF2157 domain-containing protein [Brasilonema octagenarum UFV-OR1]